MLSSARVRGKKGILRERLLFTLKKEIANGILHIAPPLVYFQHKNSISKYNVRKIFGIYSFLTHFLLLTKKVCGNNCILHEN
jgi:hypothetical protein